MLLKMKSYLEDCALVGGNHYNMVSYSVESTYDARLAKLKLTWLSVTEPNFI